METCWSRQRVPIILRTADVHSHRHMIFDKLVTNQLFLKYEYIMKKAFKETSAA